MDDGQNLYRVLGVAPTATHEEILRAYRGMLRRTHPDTRSAASCAQSDELLRQVLAAYAVLRDPQRRADYDRRRAASASGPPTPVRVHWYPARFSIPLRAGPVTRHG